MTVPRQASSRASRHVRRLAALPAIGLLAVLAADTTSLAAAAATPSVEVRVPVARAVSTVATKVAVGANRRPISPDIYGMNFADPTLAAELRLPTNRWGGNTTSRYNYTNNTHNLAADWYFENLVLSPAQSLDAFVAADKARGTRSVVTVPMIGWVSKTSPANHPFLCSYPKTTFPTQDSFDVWDPNCGNGMQGGTRLTANPQTTSVAAGPAFVQQMVAHLVATYGNAASGGVPLYELDNEPVLWNSTHPDVHPAPLTYDELAAKSTATAAAVKAADPTAKTLGPSDWGWCAYFYSAADQCGATPADRDAHGADLAPWYLRQMKAYADSHGGTRFLDYFDEHYYPQSPGVALGSAGDAATQALRLRSTRSLWDPTYVDESWIGTDVGAPPIQLIRRMKGWVAAEYPGTKTAMTEYNFGGLESVNGALAQADVLGIFGREGLDLATLWGPPQPTQPGAFAFRMYRNYDGAGSAFGQTSVSATSGARGRLTVHAAQRTADGAVTVMVINKTGAAITSTTTLAGFSPGASASRWQYSNAAPTRIVRGAAVPVTPAGWTATYPANSITLLVVPRA